MMLGWRKIASPPIFTVGDTTACRVEILSPGHHICLTDSKDSSSSVTFELGSNKQANEWLKAIINVRRGMFIGPGVVFQGRVQFMGARGSGPARMTKRDAKTLVGGGLSAIPRREFRIMVGSAERAVSCPENERFVMMRKMLSMEPDELLRYSGLLMMDEDLISSVPSGAMLFIEKRSTGMTFDGRMTVNVKNLNGEIVEFNAFRDEMMIEMRKRLSYFTGVRLDLDAQLIGREAHTISGSFGSKNIEDGDTLLITVDEFVNKGVVSSTEDATFITIRFKDGHLIPLKVDLDDTFLMTKTRISLVGCLCPYVSVFDTIAYRGSVLRCELTLREQGIVPGSEVFFPSRHGRSNPLEEDIEIVVLVKFLDSTAVYMEVQRSCRVSDIIQRLKEFKRSLPPLRRAFLLILCD
eukprot:TRINITY_DN1379_c0_g1_i4.p1 TRINITY_DN1379_c0_g1~~TRINITY_DN1379_c0_g1_i4.p1  ORF type:complete len:409 (+),score=83.02 TRINITY_DN1379_c0_g1_i4:52-1278(+)